MAKNRIQKNRQMIILILFILGYVFAGLFHEAGACVFCGICGLLLVANGRLRFYCNMESVCMAVIAAGYLLAVPYGVDGGMAAIGFLKILAAVFFFLVVMQLEQEERDRLRLAVPFLACVMVLIGVFSYISGVAYDYFYTADRFGGFFQYANVAALFCLCGIIILAGRWERELSKKKKCLSAFALLLQAAGILMSGSRTVFFLAVLSGIVIAARRKKLPMFAGILLVGMTLVAVYVRITGDVQNIGRFLTASLHSSTFVGRLLYVKDGVRLALRHPFGLGYLGYYFMEPAIQTGVYSVRYVHNDFLQLALDIGFLPALLFAAVLLKNIFGKGKRFTDRLLLAVIALHGLMDFDLEFTAVWFLVVLSLDAYRGTEWRPQKGWKMSAYRSIITITSLFAVYAGLAMAPRYFGNGELSVRLLPFYTEAKREVLAGETDVERATELAVSIMGQNEYIPEAYDILAVAEYRKGNYSAMAEEKLRSVKLQKYNMDAYNRYVILLSAAVEAAAGDGDQAVAGELMRRVADVETLLEETEAATDPLAYEIRDLPDFTLSEEVREYMEQVKSLLGQM